MYKSFSLLGEIGTTTILNPLSSLPDVTVTSDDLVIEFLYRES